MTPRDLKQAHKLLENIEQLNLAISTLRNNNSKTWKIHFVTEGGDEYAPHAEVTCLGLTQQILFLESRREAFIKEAAAFGVDTKGLDNVR